MHIFQTRWVYMGLHYITISNFQQSMKGFWGKWPVLYMSTYVTVYNDVPFLLSCLGSIYNLFLFHCPNSSMPPTKALTLTVWLFLTFMHHLFALCQLWLPFWGIPNLQTYSLYNYFQYFSHLPFTVLFYS